MTVKISLEEFREFIRSSRSFEVNVFSTACLVLGLNNPMLDLTMDNLTSICEEIQHDLIIKRGARTLYDVRKKFEKCFWFNLRSDQNENDVFVDFEVHFNENAKIYTCEKTKSCSYSTKNPSNIKRHQGEG